MAPATVLFLPANPTGVSTLELGEECRAIENEIRGARFRDRIRFRQRWAARLHELLSILNEDVPSVLHFSGHGTGDQGLCFQTDNGSLLSVSAETLEQIIRAAGSEITVIVLNACYSEVQARSLVAHVPCVIGMSGPIEDNSAIIYAGAFYNALAFGRSVANAHEQGLTALAVRDNLRQDNGSRRDIEKANPNTAAPRPKLLTRADIDAKLVYITGDSVERRRCVLVIKATLREFNADVLARVTNVLRECTGDLSLEITDIEEGSIRLTISLSAKALQKLKWLQGSGHLDKVCEFPVIDVAISDSIETERQPAGSKHINRQPNKSPVLREQSDDAILLLLAKGDKRGAIEILLEQYSGMIFRFCVRLLRDRSLAEDVTQQVFLEVHRDIEQFTHQSSIKTVILAIARHRCLDAIRLSRRQNELIQDLNEPVDRASAPHEQLHNAQFLEALEQCLQKLSPEARAAILLYYQSGMSYEEMAPLLDARADTLAVRVMRALPVLRQCLESKGWKP